MRIAMSRLQTAIMEDDSIGFCLACGHVQESVEPDAREYHCDNCDANNVYGAEEIIIMEEVIEDDDREDMINEEGINYGRI